MYKNNLSLIWNRLYLEACTANDGTTGVDMMVVTLSGLEIMGAGQLAYLFRNFQVQWKISRLGLNEYLYKCNIKDKWSMPLWFKGIFKSSTLALSWVRNRKRNHEKTAFWNRQNCTPGPELITRCQTGRQIQSTKDWNSKTGEVISWPNWRTLCLEQASSPHTHINSFYAHHLNRVLVHTY